MSGIQTAIKKELTIGARTAQQIADNIKKTLEETQINLNAMLKSGSVYMSDLRHYALTLKPKE